jgi:hypothetical protein
MRPFSGVRRLVAFFDLESGDAKTKCTNAVRAALRTQKRMTLFETIAGTA